MSKETFEQLINAVVNNKTLAEQLILQNPDSIDARNGIGETVLHYLAVENQRKEVAWLLEHGSDINTANHFGDTPLSEAASLGHYDLCEFLLDKGADLRIKTPEGDTALSEAATSDQHNVVELLLGHIKSGEPLREFFSQVTYEVLLDHESTSAKLIRLKGLTW